MFKRSAQVTATVVAVGGLLLGATACADDADDSITLYSGRNESLIAPLIADFEQQTGITVQVRYGDTAQMAAQLLTEGDRSPADAFLAQDAGALGAITDAGLFAALPDEVLDLVPAAYQARAGEWVGITGRARVLVYHPDLVDTDQLPESVFELTEPQWRGRVGVAPTNGSFQAFVTALRVQHGEDAASEWLQDLAGNDPQIRERNGPIVADVNAGAMAAGLVNHYYLFEIAKEEGVDVDELAARTHFFPDGDTGGLINVSGVGVLNHASDDPNVQEFVDYLLSVDGQTYFTEQTSEYPVVQNVTAPHGAPALDSLIAPDIDLNDLDTLEETVAMITQAGLA